ncbi:MAG TPA: HGGxSTG domain-containing protein [Candidatus Dormibacteraeota bacterium]|nr:HGGxSTG domain-containing protein [Candidatus Dormibacteraeota bacterium]
MPVSTFCSGASKKNRVVASVIVSPVDPNQRNGPGNEWASNPLPSIGSRCPVHRRGARRRWPARRGLGSVRRRGWLKRGNPSGDPSSAPRCGARTRSGNPCRAPRVRNRLRCRMHGGARGSGAPIGNRNALQHGLYTAEAMVERRLHYRLIRQSRATIERLTKGVICRGAWGCSSVSRASPP